MYSENDSTYIRLKNPVKVPLVFFISKKNTEQPLIHYTLKAEFDTTFAFSNNELSLSEAEDVSYNIYIGDPKSLLISDSTTYYFPFPKSQSYKVIQGYNGKFSHSSGDYSKYAIDFAMPVGDTVSAARDGVVIGIIEDYNIGGKNKKYRPFANFITLYHSDETLTQYVHLKHKGALVSLGDTVKALQPIGISGNTGFSGSPHLHFNVLKPVYKSLISFPIKFKSIDGKDLEIGTSYKN